MRFLRRGPSIDRETAEALLTRQYGTSGGGTVDARGRTLDAYLAAAAATGRDKEIAGEQAALAAFRAAGLAAPAARTVASRPRRSGRRSGRGWGRVGRRGRRHPGPAAAATRHAVVIGGTGTGLQGRQLAEADARGNHCAADPHHQPVVQGWAGPNA
jgi:hypothetical protein